MHIILTHEQADFDAMGALLGAALLNPAAIPVLPHRLNRNVRAFVNIYGSELPFVEARDLPGEAIESLLLVDTQSMATLKGFNQNTRVHIVDHHLARRDLPPEWTIASEKFGACTSILVEALEEHNDRLTVIQASLMLLGIYEDTGSLTYASTTSRDVHCASFLLEQGASLKILVEYLNPPLSQVQRQLYDRLLAAADTYHIHGLKVVVTTADAGDMTEEISGIAHKLRDLLDPDALLMLVNTVEGIRLVARSTTDQIDVSKIAAHLGGGGHERAAAALVRDASGRVVQGDRETLMRIRDELVADLPECVQPSITVGQIMSRRPKLLSPEDSAQDAALLMQRYGYEGYPVVKNGKVVGLLTRRAVDRALAHKLNLTAASLMETGDFTVTPLDAIDHLQSVMANAGWGQIPVVDPKSGKVIGIVTRTDLLKILAEGEKTLPGRQNLRARLISALPAGPLALLRLVADQAESLRIPLYIVGGFVRDLLLEIPSLDFDLVVEGDAIQLAHSLAEKYGGKVTSHTRFGTAKWDISSIQAALLAEVGKPVLDTGALPEKLDLISARTEYYDYPTALPTIERSNIKLDLHRRDFTFNTLAMRLDGQHLGDLYDYWGGLKDLKKGLVRVLHSLSFIDDPTRMLRAVRFEQRFDFLIETRTRELMEEARPLLRQVSGERLRHELNLILIENKASAMLTRLENLGLLRAIHPNLAWDPVWEKPLDCLLTSQPQIEWGLPTHFGALSLLQMAAYLAWFSNFEAEQVANITSRLRFTAQMQEIAYATANLRVHLPILVGQRPSQIVEQLETIAPVGLYALYCFTTDTALQELLKTYITRWRSITPHIDGRILQALGVESGPAYRSILQALRRDWLDGKIQNDNQEQELLRQYIHEYSRMHSG